MSPSEPQFEILADDSLPVLGHSNQHEFLLICRAINLKLNWNSNSYDYKIIIFNLSWNYFLFHTWRMNVFSSSLDTFCSSGPLKSKSMGTAFFVSISILLTDIDSRLKSSDPGSNNFQKNRNWSDVICYIRLMFWFKYDN